MRWLGQFDCAPAMKKPRFVVSSKTFFIWCELFHEIIALHASDGILSDRAQPKATRSSDRSDHADRASDGTHHKTLSQYAFSESGSPNRVCLILLSHPFAPRIGRLGPYPLSRGTRGLEKCRQLFPMRFHLPCCGRTTSQCIFRESGVDTPNPAHLWSPT